MPSIIILASSIVIFLFSYLITEAVIRLALRIGFVCRPNYRSSHSVLIPHGGSVGFVVPFFVTVSLLLYFGYLTTDFWLVVVGCGSLIVAVGMWDDVVDISALFRFFIQFVCVSLGVWLLSGAFVAQSESLFFEIGLAGYFISVFVLVWWLNLFNFMDGIDGLAGVETIFMAIGAILAIWLKYGGSPGETLQQAQSIELLLLFLSVSVLGFLVYNWAPAKIFMGDAGSTFLGFALGMIALVSIMSGELPISVWLILGAVFWVDATFTLMRRILAGERWYLAHKSHAYQHAVSFINNIDKAYSSRIVRRLFFAEERYTHKRVCLIILNINIFWLLPLAGLAVVLPELEFLALLLAWAPLLWIVFRLGAGKEMEITDDIIPSWPQYSADEINAVSEVLRSGNVNYWTGDNGRKFELEFAAYSGVSYGIALANGTVALELALKVLDIGPGDEVVVPPRTFIATVSSVVLSGATPVFSDVDCESQNITADEIRKCITPKTKAIIVVHLAGWPCDMHPIMELAREFNLKVIEDCAQAHGASYKGKAVGSFGDAAAFSFCQDKVMTTGGEGGMLLISDQCMWERAWAYKDHGKSYDAIYRRKQDSDEVFRWVHESFGTNWRMTEMQSVLGRIQLKKLDGWLKQRQANAQVLAKRFNAIKSLRTPLPNDDCYHSYYKFYTFIRPEFLKEGWSRDKIIHAVNSEGAICFHGSCSEVYRELAFDGTGFKPAEPLPVAIELGETSLMFPVHPTLSESDMHRIADVVDRVLVEATN